MRKINKYLPQAASWFFILLFIYAGVSKMLDFENFRIHIGKSPLLSAWAGFVSYAVIAVELLICGLLVYRRTQLAGLYASFTLMVAFTVYIWLILNFSDFVPCSCGCILEELGWTEHLLFNIACVVLAAAAIWITERDRLRLKGSILTYLGVLLAAAFGLLVVLFYSSEHIIKKENNFTRRFLQNPVTEVSTMTLAANRPYFAGTDGDRIFTGDLVRPLLLSSISDDLKQLKTMRILPEKLVEMTFRNVRAEISKGRYYLFDGTVPVIYSAKLDDPEAKIISRGDAYFTQLSVLDTARFALRTQSSLTHRYVLALLNLNTAAKVQLYDRLLEPQTDGVFDVDGLLQANDESVVYTYHYRNVFLVLDQNMNLRQRLNTIDTTGQAKISVTVLKDGSRRMDAPPLKVNENFSLLGRILFNQSNLRGKTEPRGTWKNHLVIDLYRTDVQHYLGSMKIKKISKGPLNGYIFTPDHLYILQANELKKFRYTEKFKILIKQGEAENPDQE
ncbi:tellurium resistance protein TerC [Kaistella sp. PBT33-4]|uniref:MauE/DoxX family redox-associated membrane protein n=1 Tax=Kaistella sp. PBT33-4 TaxID=3032000 RepID=UPI0023D86AF9|nr:MauE/DoxX family redox-associated membrane protein [Kaistella sp. PBT33-4]MDF0718795.1 tellurium resistance protein TerC [Kaistella sp. PBT33-4]